MKGKVLTGREALLVFAPLLIIIAPIVVRFGMPGYWRTPWNIPRENARRASCQSNLKQLALGIMQYSQDYDSKFPVNSATVGWSWELMPYTKSCPILSCPSDPSAVNATCVSYWMNANCAAKRRGGSGKADFSHPERTFLCGDGSARLGGKNYALNESSWKLDQDYARRHLDSANYSFVDGHVKWFRSEAVEANRNLSPEKSFYTFKIR